MRHVDANLDLQELAGEMLGAAAARRGKVELARILLRDRDEFLDRLRGIRRMDEQKVRARRENSYRREILDRIVVELGIKAHIDAQRSRAQKERVAVVRRFGDILGSDVLCRSRPVLDEHLLAG